MTVPAGRCRAVPVAPTRLSAQYSKYSRTFSSAYRSLKTGIVVFKPRTNSLMVPFNGRVTSRTVPSAI